MIKKITSFLKRNWPEVTMPIAGASLVLGFAPFNYVLLAFLSPATFLFCLSNSTPSKGFIRGFLFGLGLFGFGASWIYVSIYQYGGESMLISATITACFVMILSLFPALLGFLINRFFKTGYTRSLLAFPVLWVFSELLRGWIFTGFPWLFLGYTQMETTLRALAPIGSVWLISWAVAFNAGVTYELIHHSNSTNPMKKKKLISMLIVALILWITAFYFKDKQWTVPQPSLSVALIQGNIPQLMRWDPIAVDNIVQTYVSLTKENLDADIIVWPESAIPVALPYSEGLFREVDVLAKNNQVALITGVPILAENKKSFYNGMVGLGDGSGVYYKQHLVPFGEYVPFEEYLRGTIAFFNLPMSSFMSGPVMPPMMVKTYNIAPALCYEIAYPFTVRRLSMNSQMIVTVSNDTWFGTSFGPKQHLEIAQFRALETGQYVLRATNSGITAVIRPDGKIQSVIPSFETSVLRDKFFPMLGQTPWVQFGAWSLWAFLGLLGLVAILFSRRK